jgi:NitT/TauT family transport system ATP-binding protein
MTAPRGTPDATALVDIESVTMVFESDDSRTEALRGVSLRISAGEFVAIVGPSGCGKSTLLGLIAGLRRAAGGQVAYAGQPLRGVNTRVGYVTQQDNLLPWRTVERNISLALEVRGVDPAERQRQVAAMIELVGLNGFERHYPSELSGGMRKRVTLARTLIYRPETLLLDEPFGALDAQLKMVLQAELLRIWSQLRSTVVFVTHDLEEAILLADRVIVMTARPGRVRLERRIDFPRPRALEDLRLTPAFRQVYGELWSLLRPEIAAGRTA